jgi:hypothetical protein
MQEDWNNGFRARRGSHVLTLTCHHSIVPLFHYSKVSPLASAGFDADAADIMAEVEGF